MIKAFAGRKCYYLFPKNDYSKDLSILETAHYTKKTPCIYMAESAKLIKTHDNGNTDYEIGSEGDFWAVSRIIGRV